MTSVERHAGSNTMRKGDCFFYVSLLCDICREMSYRHTLHDLNIPGFRRVWRRRLWHTHNNHINHHFIVTHCDILVWLSNLKPLDVQLKYKFICFLKKCLDHDNATVKNVALIALNNPISCVGNNYKKIWRKYQNNLNKTTCVYDHIYSMCDDHMYIITVLRDMIDVKHGFKTCAYYTNNDVKYVINDICLKWNVKLTLFFNCTIVFIAMCE